VPLRKTTVALVNMFRRVDVPKEILNDQGSEFLSAFMKIYMLQSLKQLVNTSSNLQWPSTEI